MSETSKQSTTVGYARREPWLCNHVFVAWFDRDPPTLIRYHCECGANWGCPTCGWGAGQHPCRCMRDRLEAQRVA